MHYALCAFYWAEIRRPAIHGGRADSDAKRGRHLTVESDEQKAAPTSDRSDETQSATGRGSSLSSFTFHLSARRLRTWHAPVLGMQRGWLQS
jgi:hypothetical protein